MRVRKAGGNLALRGKGRAELCKALFIFRDEPPVKKNKKRKNFKEQKLQWPPWCTQTLPDLSKTAIKKPEESLSTAKIYKILVEKYK